MKTTIFFESNFFGISARLVDSCAKWKADGNSYHCKYRVFVEFEGRKTSFSFFDSSYNFSKGIRKLDKDSLKHAFYSFVSDAISGEYSFEEFCNELGYEIWDDYGDGYNKEARQIWNACRRYSEQLGTLLAGRVDIYDLVNFLNE